MTFPFEHGPLFWEDEVVHFRGDDLWRNLPYVIHRPGGSSFAGIFCTGFIPRGWFGISWGILWILFVIWLGWVSGRYGLIGLINRVDMVDELVEIKILHKLKHPVLTPDDEHWKDFSMKSCISFLFFHPKSSETNPKVEVARTNQNPTKKYSFIPPLSSSVPTTEKSRHSPPTTVFSGQVQALLDASDSEAKKDENKFFVF